LSDSNRGADWIVSKVQLFTNLHVVIDMTSWMGVQIGINWLWNYPYTISILFRTPYSVIGLCISNVWGGILDILINSEVWDFVVNWMWVFLQLRVEFFCQVKLQFLLG
jgi:hypothetical protein